MRAPSGTRDRSAKRSAPPAADNTIRPIRMATNPSWVITAYTRPAERASGRVCSVSTRTSEATAINSQASRNVVTDAAAGTSSIAATNSGRTANGTAAQVVGVADRVDAHGYRDRPGERDEEPAERVEIQRHPEQRQQPADMYWPRRAEHTDRTGPHPNSAQT